MKRIALLFFTIISINFCFAQKIIGIWQLKTSEVSSAYFDTYQFFSDGTFHFNTNQYDALRRIISIGGRYKVEKNKLSLTVEYTIEKLGGSFKVGEISAGSDSWSLTNAQIKKIPALKAATQIASVEIGGKDKGTDIVVINKAKYYKVDDDPNNFQ